MAGYHKTEAIVLRSMRLREADRIIHMYTSTRGRMGAVVKGVRRTRSRFGGRLEPFFRVRLVLYEGRGELHTVTAAEALEWYPHLRTTGASLRAAEAACETVLRLFDEGDANVGAYNLLCRELQLLDADPAASGPANLLSFRLKLLLAAGFAPQLSSCAGCGEAEHLVGFSGAAGGVVCSACEASAFALGQDAHDFLVGALGRPLAEAPDAPGAALAQAERAILATLEHHAHLRLRPVV